MHAFVSDGPSEAASTSASTRIGNACMMSSTRTTAVSCWPFAQAVRM